MITLEAKDVLPNKQHAGRRKGRQMPFVCRWWPWPLTFDLDLQTRLREWPNTCSMWIWRKSVQRLRRHFIHKQKSHRQRQNRTFLSSLRVVMIINWYPLGLLQHWLKGQKNALCVWKSMTCVKRRLQNTVVNFNCNILLRGFVVQLMSCRPTMHVRHHACELNK